MMPYLVAVFLIVLGVLTLLLKENLIKKIIGLGIMSNGIHLFIISLGYRSGGIAPILQDLNLVHFMKFAVDPLPQAMVLTSIVINLSITALALALVIRIYRGKGDIECTGLRGLKG